MSYYPANLDQLEDELGWLDDRLSGFGYERLDLDFGDTRVRVLPAYGEHGRWWFRYGMHFNLPVEGPRRAFPCPRLRGDIQDECLFCDAIKPYRQTAPDLYNSHRSRLRYMFNAINLDNLGAGVQVLEVGPAVGKDILEWANRYGDPTDPEDGYNFTIQKKQVGPQKINVEYKVVPDRTTSPLPEGALELLDNLYDLENLVEFPSAEEQRRILEDTSDALQGGRESRPLIEEDEDASAGRPLIDRTSVEETEQEDPDVEETRRRLRERLRQKRG